MFYTAEVVSIPARPSRLVTSACDKLCAQEKFFWENTMSKQVHCATYNSTVTDQGLHSLSKMEGECHYYYY